MLSPNAQFHTTCHPMNRIHHSCIRPLMRCLTNILRPALLRWTGIVALLAAALSAPAASFLADFNSGLPAGTAAYGNSSVVTTGGYTNSGYLQLTPLALSQNGGYVITNDLD